MSVDTEKDKYAGVSDIVILKDFFSASNGELLALKKSDPDAIKTLGTGIRNGTLTY